MLVDVVNYINKQILSVFIFCASQSYMRYNLYQCTIVKQEERIKVSKIIKIGTSTEYLTKNYFFNVPIHMILKTRIGRSKNV